MQDGTLNAYFVGSFLVPAVIMVAAGIARNDRLLFIAMLTSLVATYWLANLAVREKWNVRFETASTDAEIKRATTDGANLVFTALLVAPAQAVLSTALWCWVGSLIGNYVHSPSKTCVGAQSG